MSAIVGIDLGTTNSACAVADGVDVSIIDNALGEPLTPSVVAIEDDGSLVVGRAAKDMLALSPQQAASQFKRDMGRARTYRLGSRDFSAPFLSACVLDALRRDAEAALGAPVSRAVITVPAYFDDRQRFATKCAAEIAGLEVDRILNEPTAAAIAYGLDSRESESEFLVFDLGGGTFDVCVMELFDGMLAVKSVAGESRLGGEDFTAVLLEHVCEVAGLEVERLRADGGYSLMYRRCELLKRALSDADRASITIPSSLGAGAAQDLEIRAEAADKAFEPLVSRLLGPCLSALRGAAIKPQDLDEIVFVGGATRLPVVRRFVEELFSRQAMVDIDPDLVVARGAAVQASLCIGDSAVDDIIVTDVASHSIGVGRPRRHTKRDFAQFEPIIHRNTVLPTTQSKIIELSDTERDIHVYEGESRRVADNAHIGSIPIEGRLRGKDAVKLTFTSDVNGILSVEAEVVETGKKAKRVFKRGREELGGLQIEGARSELASLRSTVAPRQRELLARASLLVTAHESAPLAAALDRARAAMSGTDAAAQKSCFEELAALCVELDGGERW